MQVSLKERKMLNLLSEGASIREASLTMGLSETQSDDILRALRSAHGCKTTMQVVVKWNISQVIHGPVPEILSFMGEKYIKINKAS
jgi:hypothetical protein